MLRIVKSVNILDVTQRSVPLYFNNCKIGYCLFEVYDLIRHKHMDKFIQKADGIEVMKTEYLQQLLDEWRSDNKFNCLRGWRNEKYPINTKSEHVGDLERSGCGLFGIRTYGVHINGYTTRNGEIFMWIAKRSITKQTWPGYLDQLCAGGIPSGQSRMNAVIRECEEEASIPREISKNAIPVGLISYFLESDIGLCPETQYCYDLHVAESFTPIPNDGEVESFQLLDLDLIYQLIIEDKFKPNCAVVVIDFMVRHGYLNPDKEPHYEELVESIRRPLSAELPPPINS